MSRALDTAKSQQSNSGPIPPFVAGKNKIINGDFSIWQRGTSFSNVADAIYIADRWVSEISGVSGNTFSRQSFTAGSAPVLGYEAQYFIRCAATTATSNAYLGTSQRIEDVRTFAGQTVTLSFWAKADSARAMSYVVYQNFGSGGSSQIVTVASAGTNSTSWTRYSVTISIASVAGKTIGSGSYLQIGVLYAAANLSSGTATLDLWGLQIETGSTATPFQTATGTIQGELAACQRYYFRTQTGTGYPYMGVTVAGSSTTTYANIIHKVTMRSTPTSVDFSAIRWQAINNSGNISSASISDATPENTLLVCGTTGATTAQMNYVIGQTTSGYIGISAEL
jgi:hypothetical protein